LYFSGGLNANPENLNKMLGLFYPYAVTDIYGLKLIPENLGNYEVEAFNSHPPRLENDLIEAAETNLVVRDSIASFFFHPFLNVSILKEIVEGVKARGYTFVDVSSI
jgi:uncharacterized protein YdaL